MKSIFENWSPYTHNSLEIFKILWEAEISKCSNLYIWLWGSKRSALIRGFQIWFENLNQITFDTVFDPKTVESCQKRNFPPFWQFFLPKGIKCYHILILRPDMESSRRGGSFRPPYIKISTFWFFQLPIVFWKLQGGSYEGYRGVN